MAAATIVKKKKILEGSNKKREIMKETQERVLPIDRLPMKSIWL